jgi:hypothetical protein
MTIDREESIYMYVATISGTNVKVFDVNTSAQVRMVGCASYKGAYSAVVEGGMLVISCGDGKVRVFDIKSGAQRRTF